MKKIVRFFRKMVFVFLMAFVLICALLPSQKIQATTVDTATTPVNFGEGDTMQQPEDHTETNEENQETQDNDTEEDLLENEFDEQAQTQEEAEIQSRERAYQLQPNEQLVSTFAELKTNIENAGNGQFDTYYFTANIVGVLGGIKVPANYSFTIDGTDPNTGIRYTYYEYRSATAGYNIWYGATSNATIKTLQMRNMNIEGQNYYGALGASASNVVTHYKNVTYNGPQIGYNVNGTVIIEDSDVNIVRGRGSAAEEIMEARDGELRGKNTFRIDSGKLVMFQVPNSVTFKSGSDTTFYTDRSIVNNTGTLMIEENAYVAYLVNQNISSTSVNTIITTNEIINKGTFYVKYPTVTSSVVVARNKLENTGTINLEVDKVGGYVINVVANIRDNFINRGGKIRIIGDTYSHYILFSYYFENIEGATLEVSVNDARNTYNFLIYNELVSRNSTMDIQVGKTKTTSLKHSVFNAPYVYIENSKVNISTGESNYGQIFYSITNWTFITTGDMPSYLITKNNSATPKLVETGTKNAQIQAPQINAWMYEPSFTNYPDESLGASERMAFKSNQQVTIVFRNQGTTTTVQPGSTGATEYSNTSSFSPMNRRLIAMGNIVLDHDETAADSNLLTLETNPHAWVNLQATPPVYTYANESGNVNEVLPEKLPNGAYIVKTFGNYLYRESNITYLLDGNLTIDSVSALSYGQAKITTLPATFERQENFELVVKDERAIKSGWTLTARLEAPLQVPNQSGTTLPDALVYKGSATESLGLEPIVIHEMQPGAYDELTTISWEDGQGVLLSIENMQNIYINKGYSANVIWELKTNEA